MVSRALDAGADSGLEGDLELVLGDLLFEAGDEGPAAAFGGGWHYSGSRGTTEPLWVQECCDESKGAGDGRATSRGPSVRRTGSVG